MNIDTHWWRYTWIYDFVCCILSLSPSPYHIPFKHVHVLLLLSISLQETRPRSHWGEWGPRWYQWKGGVDRLYHRLVQVWKTNQVVKIVKCCIRTGICSYLWCSICSEIWLYIDILDSINVFVHLFTLEDYNLFRCSHIYFWNLRLQPPIPSNIPIIDLLPNAACRSTIFPKGPSPSKELGFV